MTAGRARQSKTYALKLSDTSTVFADAIAAINGAVDDAEAQVALAETARTGAETARAGAEDAQAEVEAIAATFTDLDTSLAQATASSAAAVAAAATAEAARDAAVAGTDEFYTSTAAGISGTVNGDFFTVVEGDYMQVYENVSSVATAVTGARYPTSQYLGNIPGLFSLATTTNLFDPTKAIAGQNVNASGSTGVIARYGRLRFAAAASTQYTVSCDYAATDWKINQSAWVNCYNSTTTQSAGTLVSSLSGGSVSYTDSGRTVTFTTPAGTVWVELSLYNNTTASPSAGDFTTAWSRIMVNTGATKADFQEAITSGQKAFPSTVTNTPGKVRYRRSGTNAYISQPDWQRPTTHRVARQLAIGVAASSTASGCVDFLGKRMISASYGLTLDDVAWNSGTVVHSGNDNGPPVKINNAFLGGGHGLPATETVTMTGHGLTNANVGDVGTASSKSWVLTRIVDANTVTLVAANTGASEDRWTISGSLAASGTMVFAAAGSKSWTARTATQFWPILQNLSQTVEVDGIAVTGDGTWSGSAVSVIETYGIPNPANWLATLIAERGTSTPKLLNDPAIATQLFIRQVWTFDDLGALRGNAFYRVGREFIMSGGGTKDYAGGWQQQVISNAGTLHMYIPGLNGAVGGYDFGAIADITANNAVINIVDSNLTDVTKPPQEFVQLTRTSGTNIRALAFGYMDHKGTASERAQNDHHFWMSQAEKWYPVGVDGNRYAGGVVPVGTVWQLPFWEQFWDMGTYPTHTIDAAYRDGNYTYRVIHIHAVVSNYTLPVPKGLEGQPVTVLRSSNFTLHTSLVADSDVIISTSASPAFAVLRIG